MRDPGLRSLWDDYVSRMQWKTVLHETGEGKPADTERRMLEKLDSRAFCFMLDEKGKSLRSTDFAARIGKLTGEGYSRLQFVIGGADGFSAEAKKRAGFLLAFGEQTWPHMLVRVMLAEQLYRAQQILAGHPYHRE